MIPFLLAVNVHTGSVIFEIAEAEFSGGLNSRDFHGQAHITQNDSRKLKFDAMTNHFWVEGNIDYSSMVQFKVRLTATGSSSGWYRISGVEYPGDGLWRGFTARAAANGAGFTLVEADEIVQ